MIRHGSLFSGIGGFDLAASWNGINNIFHCEFDEWNRKVLKHHFPDSESFADITKTDFKKYYDTIDIVSGGFPCQPFSIAGERKGTEDDRHLWKEMLRAITEIKPKWVIAENVYGLVNISRGVVFEEVCTDLEAEGYAVQSFIIPAVSKNAPHRRDRVWIVGHTHKIRLEKNLHEKGEDYKNGENSKRKINEDSIFSWASTTNECNSSSTNSHKKRQQRREEGESKNRQKPANKQSEGQCKFSMPNFEMFPSEPPLCSGNDGLSGRLDGISFSKWRKKSLESYGNAIVPQVASEIFRAIVNYEKYKNKEQL